MLRRRALFLTSFTLAGALVAGDASAGSPQPIPTGREANLPKPERADERSIRLRAALGAGWSASRDLVAYGFGDADGYHVTVARQAEGFAWRTVATIQPDGYDEDDWTGYSCLTGDGRYVVAVVAPRHFVNRLALRDRGASAYVVDLAGRSVHLVASDVALKYHTPGCGTGSTAVVVRHLGVDQQATELLTIDAVRARVVATTRVDRQVTSAVPTPHGVVGAMGPNVVRIGRDGTPVRLVDTRGMPYALRPNASGGVDYLVKRGTDARLFTTNGAARAATALGSGRLDRVALYLGRGGRNVVVGLPTGAGAGRLRRVAGTSPVTLLGGASLDGHVTLAHLGTAAGRKRLAATSGDAHHPAVTSAAGDVLMLAASDGKPLPNRLATAPAARVTPPFRAAPPNAVGAGRLGRAVTGPLRVAGNSTTPACAVPRNHLQRQAPQPTTDQLDWAAQAAVRGLLTAANGNGRPANYLNMGLAAYAPNTDFTIPALAGASGGQGIPRLVVEGIMAQENAFRHASRRALPGLAGNPAISDYYGSAGTLDTIDYDKADCGYGVMQVTTGMRASDGSPYSANGKTKIAVDYAENIVAGSKILANFWNQLHANGVTLNGGDPRYLENWYFALWAYNTGLRPVTSAEGNTTGCAPSSTCTDSGGNWGLGWTNNPQNADYPPNRDPFLRTTYADAEHPSDWPYQERVMGWMETPILDYKGRTSYAGPSYPAGRTFLSLPAHSAFCSTAPTTGNNCDPTYESPAGDDLDYCKYDVTGPLYRHCWWHTAVTFASCATQCALSAFTYSTTAHEPAATNPYPPACDSDRPPTAVVVDNQPEPAYNVVGCGTRNWTNNGTFALTWGSDTTGAPVGVIDVHQLGAGLGGHTWFAKNRAASDTAHRVTGTWTPPANMAPGLYVIAAHIPESGASTASARYLVTQADGSFVERKIDQHLHQDTWVGLGAATLGPGSKVVLTNATDDPNPGVHNVAFDAMAFVAVSGTVVERTIDTVSIFSENQDMDAAGTWWGGPDSPFNSRQKLYDWAVKYSSGLLAPEGYQGGISYPPCNALTGQNGRCIGQETRDAFQAWHDEVRAAGTHPMLHPPGKSIPRWVAFANDDPTAAVATRGTAAALSDDESYKIRTRAKVSYVVSGVTVVPGSISQSVEQRTGDTALPEFVTSIFDAYETDYGIRPPNLDYDNYDLNVYTHESTHVEASRTNRFPGRAYRHHTASPQITDNGTCVRVKSIGGGVIGYRPMLGAEVVSAEVDRWRDDANDAVDAGRAPAVVGDFASEIFNAYFKTGFTGALWNKAAPIWLLTSFRACGAGTILPDAGLDTIAYASYMPDVYVFADNQPIGQNGQPAVGPVWTGDFKNFTNDPVFTGAGNAYGQCSIPRRDRGGNPWSINSLDTVDTRPDRVVFCDHEPIDDSGEG